jgi:hypothetical protein
MRQNTGLERYNSTKLLATIWSHLINIMIVIDLKASTVREEIRCYSFQYSAPPSAHLNGLIVNLTELPDNRRLRRHLPNDLPTRFFV